MSAVSARRDGRGAVQIAIQSAAWDRPTSRLSRLVAGRSGSARRCARNDVDDAKPAIKRGSYLGSSLASCFLISGLSYKTTFNSELRISSFPLYSI